MYSCYFVSKNVQYNTHHPLLPSDVRDSAAVVYGPTFSCPSMSGPPAAPNPLSLVCSLEPLFSEERCIHRRNDTALCYRHSELVGITSHHILHTTSLHTTSLHTKPLHNTSLHITTLRTFCCKTCIQGHKISLCSHSRYKKTFFKATLNDTPEPRSANMPACLCDNLPNGFDGL
jgi:hypothetical protein